jgi:chemotaxis protein methyltransferase CheR
MLHPPNTKSDTARFRDVIAHRLGLFIEDAKLGWLSEVLQQRVEAIRQDPARYLSQLETEGTPDEIARLADALTVPETCFFRNRDHFRALAEVALPDRMAARRSVKQLRILSAGCASGEETYSIAMIVREAVDPSWAVSILGVDVNPIMVQKAERARYSAWAMREIREDIRDRWFRRDGREFALDDELRQMARFEVANLVEDDPRVWAPRTYDIVFCRNVLMYFTPHAARALVARIAAALQPGGYLFLGHAETLRGLSNDFDLQHTHGTFYYRLRGALPAEQSLRRLSATPTRIDEPVADVNGADSWIDAIQRASERIGRLSKATEAQRAIARAPEWDLQAAFELLRQERFQEALRVLEALPPDAMRDPDVLLLKAALEAHSGRLEEAERTCRDLLEIDGFNAGAHYLLALCHEHVNDSDRAMYEDQIAIYLDPSFAMPRLHLGLLAKRSGDRAVAQRELERALLLLDREDSARLLLFGGGFGRRTLTDLCRAELQACGAGR